MLDQRYKDICFNFLLLPNKINFFWQKFIVSWLFRRPPLMLHLGCGGNYLDGLINIEANIFKKKDIWLDLRNGLPFPNDSVSSIYAHSFCEHLYPGELAALLKECQRVLKPGSGMRIAVPDLAVAAKGYIIDDLSWVSDFPRHFDSLGGKFYNFIFCDGQHKMCFDFTLLEELLTQAGFGKISRKKPRESQIYSNEQIKEKVADPAHLYVECFKKEA